MRGHTKDLGPFCDLSLRHPKTKSQENPKLPLLSHVSSNPKNKDTLFSPTFKIEENKVLFFGLEVTWLSYGNLVFSRDFFFGCLRLKSQNGHRCLIWPLIQKIRTLYILQLSNWRKWVAFIFWIGGHMRHLWQFCDLSLRHPKKKSCEDTKLP